MRRLISCLILTSIFVLTLGSTAFAADFDPNYYATTNPDVVAALGNDGQTLYNHYQSNGKTEGRLAYAGAQPGEEVTFDPKAAAKAAAEQQEAFKAIIMSDTYAAPDDFYYDKDGNPVYVCSTWDSASNIFSNMKGNTYMWIATVAYGKGRASRVLNLATENGLSFPSAKTEFRDKDNPKKTVISVNSNGDVFDALGKFVIHYDM